MPVYEYACLKCGPFDALRPMAEYQAPLACPSCGLEAERVILSVPNFALMAGADRNAHAVNERSADSPGIAQTSGRGHVHGPNCGCGLGARSKTNGAPAAKGFPAKRPWMISH